MKGINTKKYQLQWIRVWKDSGDEIILGHVYDVEGTKEKIDELNKELSKENAIVCYELRRQPKQQMFSSGPN